MRKGRFIAGVVLLLIGIGLVGLSLAVNASTSSQTVPAGSAWVITPTSSSAVTADISWTANNASTQTYLVTGTAVCSDPTGVVASGSGASGSFSATLSPGGHYSLYACSGASYETAQFSMTISGGISLGEIIGAVLLVLGGLLVFLGIRRGKDDEGARGPDRRRSRAGSAAGPVPGATGLAMQEETRPILGPLLGILGGGIPLYWSARELWVLWKAGPKSKLVQLLVGKSVKVTPGLIAELRGWFGVLTIVEVVVVAAALLLVFFPRMHYLLAVLILAGSALGFGLMYDMPYAIGRTVLYAGLIVCPFLAILGGISGIVFRSDLEFSRAYGLD